MIDDPPYRQCASGCIKSLRFPDDYDFLKVVECLIDLQKVFVRVKQKPIIAELEGVANLIESNNDQKFKSELANLNKKWNIYQSS